MVVFFPDDLNPKSNLTADVSLNAISFLWSIRIGFELPLVSES